MLSAKALPIVAALMLALMLLARPAQAASGPSPATIRAAVAKARHSRDLWSTVNVCTPRRKPHVVGVRAQMPALGFPAWISIQIQLDYWNKAHHRFVPLAGSWATRLVHLGIVSAGLQQGGYNFVLPAHAGLLRGTVTYRWRRNGQLLLTQIRHTVAGHPRADQGIPAHYSAATCRVR
jgi:hypothetical protein